jgi:hypothetical protein
VAKTWARQWFGHRASPPRPSHSPLDCDLAANGLAIGLAPHGQVIVHWTVTWPWGPNPVAKPLAGRSTTTLDYFHFPIQPSVLNHSKFLSIRFVPMTLERTSNNKIKWSFYHVVNLLDFIYVL